MWEVLPSGSKIFVFAVECWKRRRRRRRKRETRRTRDGEEEAEENGAEEAHGRRAGKKFFFPETKILTPTSCHNTLLTKRARVYTPSGVYRHIIYAHTHTHTHKYIQIQIHIHIYRAREQFNPDQAGKTHKNSTNLQPPTTPKTKGRSTGGAFSETPGKTPAREKVLDKNIYIYNLGGKSGA